MELIFDKLLSNLLVNWPEEIDLTGLEKSSSESTHYSIKGLYNLSEKISEHYGDTSEDVLMNDLNDAIYEILHGLAAYTTRVKMSELRHSAIRAKFERRLGEALEMTELGFLPEDIQLINEYFSVNKKT